jgi:hypothetical protein
MEQYEQEAFVKRNHLKMASLLVVDLLQVLVSTHLHKLPAVGIWDAYFARLCMGATVVLCLALLSKTRCLMGTLGSLITFLRVLLVLGFGVSAQLDVWKTWYAFLYVHRCFIVSLLAAAMKIPHSWYWVGSGLSVICALAQDHIAQQSLFPLEALAQAAGAATAGSTAALMWQLLLAAAADPLVAMGSFANIPASRVATSAAEVLLPGLLLHVLHAQPWEGLSRQRQQQQQSSPSEQVTAAAASSPPASKGRGDDNTCTTRSPTVAKAATAGVSASAGRCLETATDHVKAGMVDQAAREEPAFGDVTSRSSCRFDSIGQLGREYTLSDSASSVKAVLEQLGLGGKPRVSPMILEQSHDLSLSCLVDGQCGPPDGPSSAAPVRSAAPLQNRTTHTEAAQARQGTVRSAEAVGDGPGAGADKTPAAKIKEAGSSSICSKFQDQAAALAALRYHSPLVSRTCTVVLNGPPNAGTLGGETACCM